jgi:hypothetical protein
MFEARGVSQVLNRGLVRLLVPCDVMPEEGLVCCLGCGEQCTTARIKTGNQLRVQQSGLATAGRWDEPRLNS